MASKYLQKYPVPENFHQILHDFTREVLRDQPDDIIKYGMEYFESMRDGKPFNFQSKYNIAKGQAIEKKYQTTKPKDYIEQSKKVVDISNLKQDVERKSSAPAVSSVRQLSAGSQASFPEEKKAAVDYVNELYQKVEHDIDQFESGKSETQNAFFQPQFDGKDLEKIIKIQASAKGMLVRNQLKQQQQEGNMIQEEEEEVYVQVAQKPHEDGEDQDNLQDEQIE
ncbi:unnamed protein product [Paramecium primaurelia]|uniref:RIIa domain-containing protein n=2 Tax=Paramecium TaxID=5884 RepID=A0A8S1YE74_9CILI|nr:unnamed protein product [Paramecium primaurelia]CAD8212796.1 unnamed protein product [Paramecium pentaurelia]